MSRVVAPSAIRVPISLGYERVAHMERELLADTGDGRLLPYMSLHEFEAIVFVSPTSVAADTSADLASSCWQVTGAAACWQRRSRSRLRRGLQSQGRVRSSEGNGPSNKELKLTKRG
jgi:hypothetical protein